MVDPKETFELSDSAGPSLSCPDGRRCRSFGSLPIICDDRLVVTRLVRHEQFLQRCKDAATGFTTEQIIVTPHEAEVLIPTTRVS